MTALTANDRVTVEAFSAGFAGDIPLTASTKIVGNVMVMVISGTGTALNAADTANGLVMGISAQQVDTAVGHTKCPIKRGDYWFNNNGNITAAKIGLFCEVVDNQTVGLAADTTNHVVAGEILDVATVNSVSQVLVGMRGTNPRAT